MNVIYCSGRVCCSGWKGNRWKTLQVITLFEFYETYYFEVNFANLSFVNSMAFLQIESETTRKTILLVVPAICHIINRVKFITTQWSNMKWMYWFLAVTNKLIFSHGSNEECGSSSKLYEMQICVCCLQNRKMYVQRCFKKKVTPTWLFSENVILACKEYFKYFCLLKANWEHN